MSEVCYEPGSEPEPEPEPELLNLVNLGDHGLVELELKFMVPKKEYMNYKKGKITLVSMVSKRSTGSIDDVNLKEVPLLGNLPVAQRRIITTSPTEVLKVVNYHGSEIIANINSKIHARLKNSPDANIKASNVVSELVFPHIIEFAMDLMNLKHGIKVEIENTRSQDDVDDCV